MNCTEKIKEFCNKNDFRNQRDVLGVHCCNMIMMLSALNARYYSSFACKPTLECYAWLDALVDIEMSLTMMAIYCGEESLEKYIYGYDEEIKRYENDLMQNKDDVYILAYLLKAISKARANTSVQDMQRTYGRFKTALYFAIKRFLDDARDSVLCKGLTEYYNQLYSKKVDKMFKDLEEEKE